MGQTLSRQEEEEEEEYLEAIVESWRQGEIERETSDFPEGVPFGLDGGGVCGDQSPTGRECRRPSRLGMGQHSHKRDVLRTRPSESHDHRRRLVSHRLSRPTQERQSPRSLEGVANQVRQLDKQEGSSIVVKVKS